MSIIKFPTKWKKRGNLEDFIEDVIACPICGSMYLIVTPNWDVYCDECCVQIAPPTSETDPFA